MEIRSKQKRESGKSTSVKLLIMNLRGYKANKIFNQTIFLKRYTKTIKFPFKDMYK